MYVYSQERDGRLVCFVDVLTAQACCVGWGFIGVHIIMLRPNVNPMWQRFYLFFKACTKGCAVISCLTPPLNTDIVKQ